MDTPTAGLRSTEVISHACTCGFPLLARIFHYLDGRTVLAHFARRGRSSLSACPACHKTFPPLSAEEFKGQIFRSA